MRLPVTEGRWIAFLQRPEIPAFNRAMLINPDDDLPRNARGC